MIVLLLPAQTKPTCLLAEQRGSRLLKYEEVVRKKEGGSQLNEKRLVPASWQRNYKARDIPLWLSKKQTAKML